MKLISNVLMLLPKPSTFGPMRPFCSVLCPCGSAALLTKDLLIFSTDVTEQDTKHSITPRES